MALSARWRRLASHAFPTDLIRVRWTAAQRRATRDQLTRRRANYLQRRPGREADSTARHNRAVIAHLPTVGIMITQGAQVPGAHTSHLASAPVIPAGGGGGLLSRLGVRLALRYAGSCFTSAM